MRTKIIVFSPKTVEYLYTIGKPVILIDNSHIWWDISTESLIILKKYNKKVCHEIVQYDDADI